MPEENLEKCFICEQYAEEEYLFTNENYPGKGICWTCYDKDEFEQEFERRLQIECTEGAGI